MSPLLFEPGRAPERTVLARQRSALALGALAAVFLRVGTHEGARMPLIAAGIALVVAAVAAALLSHQLGPANRARAATALTLLTLAIAALALAGTFATA